MTMARWRGAWFEAHLGHGPHHGECAARHRVLERPVHLRIVEVAPLPQKIPPAALPALGAPAAGYPILGEAPGTYVHER